MNPATDEGQLFCLMFPDSAIAKEFSLGSDKMSYLINFGLAPSISSVKRVHSRLEKRALFEKTIFFDHRI